MQIHRRRRLHFEKVPVDAAESFAARDFQLPAFPFVWHRHPELELTLILQGRGMRYVADSIEPFAIGDLCLLGTDTPHTWYSDRADGAVRSLVVQFPHEMLAGPFFNLPELRDVRAALELARRGLMLQGEPSAAVRAQMKQLFMERPGSAGRLGLLLEMLSGFADALRMGGCRVLGGASAGSPAKNDKNDVIARTLARLRSGPDAIPSEAHAAASVGLKPAAFSRLFKRQMGKTYVQYVTDWRISQICRQLVDTDQSITEIAFACGFGNLSNFNRRFKIAKGLTPRAYRALARPALPPAF